jgi:hypothetical protein
LRGISNIIATGVKKEIPKLIYSPATNFQLVFEVVKVITSHHTRLKLTFKLPEARDLLHVKFVLAQAREHQNTTGLCMLGHRNDRIRGYIIHA